MATQDSKRKETLSTRSFEHKWVIRNWKDVVRNETLIEVTNTEIILEAEDIVFAKFLVGTSMFQNKDNCLGFYWKLISNHDYMDNMQANLVTEVLNSSGKVAQVFEVEENAVIGKTMEIKVRFWSCDNSDSTYADYVNHEGSLEIKLTFTLKNLSDWFEKEEEFFKTSRDEICQNLAALLNDERNSDVKFLTKDNIELFAHKTILRAQCPVFASMFGSDFRETSTGVIQVDDISAKTMKILLKYWYTGALLPSWRDEDTVVEFTYAAGKYQMGNILKMLDDVMGPGSRTAGIDVELLRMVHNLSLKNAEARILQRVIRKITDVVSGSELLEMFYQTCDLPVGENFGGERILKVWEDTIGEIGEREASCEDIKMMAFASKLGMKKVENELLKRVMDAVNKVDSAEEMFAIFDLQIEPRSFVSAQEDLNTTNLLVRAVPK